MIPLCFAQLNKDFYIIEIDDCKKSKCCLLEKGLCVGNKVNIHAKKGNSFVVKINDTMKYVIGFGIARKILVNETKSI